MNRADLKTLKDFGKMIRELRRGKRLSIAELAVKSGIAAMRLQGVEGGTADANLIEIWRIADGLEMSASVIFVNGVDAQPRRRK
jgi:transcriptional regulator with XRE-family HTH domain